MTLTLEDMKYMLETRMFEVFPSVIDYSMEYLEFDRRYSRTHVGRQWFNQIKKTFPEAIKPGFVFRMKSWDTFNLWVVPKYQVYGDVNRAERERQAVIQFLNDWIAKGGNINVNL